MRASSLATLAVVAACSAPAAPRPTAPPTRPVDGPLVDAAAAPVATIATTDEPGLRLPKTFVATSYTAKLTIDPAKPRFSGRIVIDGTITAPTSVVWLHAQNLDFSVVTGPGTPGLDRIGDRIALRFETPRQPGPWSVTLEYTGAIDPQNTLGAFAQTVARASYVYTQFEATYARRVFPCIDEPDSKVPWQLTLDVPKANVAVSNTQVVRESDAGNGLRRFEFAKTKPLPSYLVAFGVGPFEILDAGKAKSGVPVRVVTLRGRGPDAAYAVQNTVRVLDLLETWFGVPYPYDKLDMLTIPLTLGFGAMENAGLITHAESAILFDPATLSMSQRYRYIRLVAHELAHQWFGNLVTMTWWDDLWLNEAFATWLASRITGELEPAWQSDQDALDVRARALHADSVVSARRVRQPIVKVDDIEAAFDGITYSKGAAVIAMFEAFAGRDVFQRGVRDYIKAHAFANATSADFVGAINAAAGTDLTAAFSTFLDQVGAPELEATLVCDKAGARLQLVQQRHVAPGSPDVAAQTWQMPVCVAYEQGGKRASTCTMLTTATGTLALGATGCPRWVMPNREGQGYYRVRYTQKQAVALRDEAWRWLTPVERRTVFHDLQAGVTRRDRALPLSLALSYVPKLLAHASRFAVDDALAIPLSVERMVPAALADKFAYYIRTTFGPGATRLGLVAGPRDTLDDEATRASLVRAVAWLGRDPDLVAKAVELAASWRDLGASTRALILQIAVDADAGLAAKIMREVKVETDRARRTEMFAALASQRDPKRYEAALELTLDPAIDLREATILLFRPSVEATRAVAERFLRVNETKLFARLPPDALADLSWSLARVFSGSCDPTKRADAKAYVDEHYGTLRGGRQMIAQTFESMDQCIASRESMRPSVSAWLGGIRVKRPSRP